MQLDDWAIFQGGAKEGGTISGSTGKKDWQAVKDDEKQIRKKFIMADTYPKILIVTEKLLTGFDAPILYAMYLDKPMRDHTLLQAIARVNRPYEDKVGKKKPYGFVMDFVGIFENLEKALAFDSDVVSGVIKDLKLLKDLFATLMREKAQPYLQLAQGKMDDKMVEKIVYDFSNKDKRDEFNRFYREVGMLYEIISPDASLRPYIDDYTTLSEIFKILHNAFDPRIYVDREFLRKTAALVRDKITSTAIDASLPIYPMDNDLIEKLKAKHATDTVRVINLIKIIRQWVEGGQEKEPYLIEIGERAEKVRGLYEDRQLTTKEALAELEKLVDQTVEAKDLRTAKKMDVRCFTVFWVLREEGLKDEIADTVSREIAGYLGEFQDWDGNDETKRQMKAAMYKTLMKTPINNRMVEVVDRVLKLQTDMRSRV